MVDYPNVPDVPGVPALARGPSNTGFSIPLLFQDLVSFLVGSEAAQWGLFKDGVPVVIADSVLSFDYRQDFQALTYPIEEGGFETYNKVQLPFAVRLRFGTGGSESDREALLSSIAAAVASNELFDAVTPEAIYLSVNPIHQDYKRDKNNVGIIAVDVWCTEIRVTATAAFGNTQATQNAQGGASNSTTVITARPAGTSAAAINNPQSPSAAPQVNDGIVQPVPIPSTTFSDPLTGFM